MSTKTTGRHHRLITTKPYSRCTTRASSTSETTTKLIPQKTRSHHGCNFSCRHYGHGRIYLLPLGLSQKLATAGTQAGSSCHPANCPQKRDGKPQRRRLHRHSGPRQVSKRTGQRTSDIQGLHQDPVRPPGQHHDNGECPVSRLKWENNS